MLHVALNSSQRGFLIAGQALRDCFLVMRSLSLNPQIQPLDNSDDATNKDSSRTMTGLHSWFPTQNDAINGQPATSGRQQYILCHDEVIDSLSRLTSIELSEL